MRLDLCRKCGAAQTIVTSCAFCKQPSEIECVDCKMIFTTFSCMSCSGQKTIHDSKITCFQTKSI